MIWKFAKIVISTFIINIELNFLAHKNIMNFKKY